MLHRLGFWLAVGALVCACGGESTSDPGAGSGGKSGSGGSAAAGASSGGAAGSASSSCKPQASQDSQCSGKPPHLYGCFNGVPYQPPAGCVNIYIGNATDFWCCP